MNSVQRESEIKDFDRYTTLSAFGDEEKHSKFNLMLSESALSDPEKECDGDLQSTSRYSEENDLSPQSSPVALPLPIRRRSDADVHTPTSASKFPNLSDMMGRPSMQVISEQKERTRRASTSNMEFSREHIQSFEQNLGRSYFFLSVANSLMFNSRSTKSCSLALSDSTHSEMPTSGGMHGGGIIKQGWLMKKGGVVPTWRKKWFTLSHRYTIYC